MLTSIILMGFAGTLAHAALDDVKLPKRIIRYTRNGGMRFLRIHKLQLSMCMCKKGL
jgi:hypothetical protein